jgi:hypothetical protein
VVTRHYSQALHPDGKLWRVIYKLRWVPRLALVGVLVWIGAMAFDREPPFKLLSYWTNQPKPGGTLVVRAKVQRDLDRECSVTSSRYLFDKVGARHEASGQQMMTPQALRNMDALAPGELNLQVPIPLSFPPGPATLTTVLEYRCNPLQDIARPIPVEMSVPFEVVP